jgi:hypothetical protein
MCEGSNSKVKEVFLGDDLGAALVLGDGIMVEANSDGSVIVYTTGTVNVKVNGVSIDVGSDGTVNVKPGPANDTAAKATPEIGAIESTGEHKGEIYGGIYPPDNKPIWFSAAPKLMDHYKAAAWAQGQGGSLPTRKQGDYLTTLKGKGGAFTEIFNRGGSFPAGSVWLAEPDTYYRNLAWSQRLSDGDQRTNYRNYELPVLCVRR